MPASAYKYIIGGDEVFEFCVSLVEAKNDLAQMTCAGYVWGVVDFMYRNDQEWQRCVEGRDLHGKQLREVVTNYLKAHPEHRDLPGLEQVRLALFSAYCSSE